jgi:hypothetical protein
MALPGHSIVDALMTLLRRRQQVRVIDLGDR